jgi:hypothetical protein
LAAAILLNAGPGRFNPQQVLADLYAHRHLWCTFLMGLPIPVCADVHLPPSILLPLRDERRPLEPGYTLSSNTRG